MAKTYRKSGFNGEMLRHARRYKRLTQGELAEELGVHRTTLVRWESGLTEPSRDQIDQLSMATSTPKQWFMGEAAEAISFDDPCWLLDPVLTTFPLEELQSRTAAALKALGKTTAEVARATFLAKQRVEALMQGHKPTAREIQRLRDTFGQHFNPTPVLTRRLEPLAPARRVATDAEPAALSMASVTSEERHDLVLQRLLRLETRLERMESAQLAILAMLESLVPKKAAGKTP